MIVKKSLKTAPAASPGAPAPAGPAAADLSDLSLPTEVKKITRTLRDSTLFIHGEKKIGKSSLLAYGEPESFFLEFDPIQPYDIMQRTVPTWPHMLKYLEMLEGIPKSRFQYPTIVVDRVDLMYQRCFDHICGINRVSYPPTTDFGKVWKAISTEFSRVIARLMELAPTRWICHSEITVEEDTDGNTRNRLVPVLPGQADKAFSGLMDITGAYMYQGKKRLLLIQGNENVIAGHRMDKHFFTQKNRERVVSIPMGDSGLEAYNNLQAAFDNKQILPYAYPPEEKKAVVKKTA